MSDYNQYSQKKPKFKLIPILIFVTIFILIILVFVLPNSNPNRIKGSIKDILLIPDSKVVWFETDKSFSFTEKEVTPDKQIAKKINFSKKVQIYFYDPFTKKTTKTFNVKSKSAGSLYYVNDKVIQICSPGSSGVPEIFYYDPLSGLVTMDTKSFISNHPELKAGISSIFDNNMPSSIDIKTKDGFEFIYYVKNDTLFDRQNTNYNKERLLLLQSYPDIKNCFVFGVDTSSSSRKRLYLLKGNEMVLLKYKKVDAYLDNSKIKSLQSDEMGQFESMKNDGLLNDFDREISIENPLLISREKVYLEGLIFYQDNDIAVIMHQDQVGKTAERFITAVNTKGKELWNISAPKIFKEMRVSEDNPFFDTFFIKSIISGNRSGNLFLLKLNNVGFAFIDMENGDVIMKRKW